MTRQLDMDYELRRPQYHAPEQAAPTAGPEHVAVAVRGAEAGGESGPFPPTPEVVGGTHIHVSQSETSEPAGSGDQPAGATHACGPKKERPSIDERFEKFDREHPDVWRLFERFTFELIDRGFEHGSSDDVLHRVRWETRAGSTRPDEYKINNDFTALYARKWNELHPEHATFFRLRERRAA